MAKAPGAYHKIIDGSTYRRASGDLKVGIVGAADWGPVSTPTLCASPGDFTAKFGGSYQGAYAALNTLQNTSHVYYSREINTDDAAKSTVDIVWDSTSIITVTAKYYGTFGNNISVQVRPASNGSALCFDLLVKVSDVTVETFKNLAESTYTAVVSSWVVLSEASGSPVWPVDWPTDAANSVEFDLAGGDSGESLDSTILIGAKGVAEVSEDSGIYVYADEDWRMLDVIAVPGYSDTALITALQNMINFYHSKQVMWMIDIPTGLSRDNAMAWVNGTGTGPTASLNDYSLFFSYPWHNMEDSSGTEYAVAPSAVALGVWAQALRTSLYKAPAGPKRGLWPYSSSLATYFKKPDIAVMYSEPGENINVWYMHPEKGIMLYGHKTAYRANSDLADVKIVLNLNRMIKELDYLLEDEIMEDNNAILWSKLATFAEQVMGGRKSSGLLYDYEFVCDENTNTVDGRITTTTYATVRVQFTPTSDWIEVSWILSPAGSEFNY